MNFLKSSFFVVFFSFKGLLASSPDFDVLDTSHRINGSLMNEALGAKKAEVLDLLWGLYRNDKLISHGIMVNSKGYLLSKASSSMGARYALSYSGKYLPIRIRKRDEKTDLALWQITDSSKLWPFAEWHSDLNKTKIGNWAISGNKDLSGLTFGVISAKSRSIGRQGGVMGVILEESNSSTKGIEVLEVLPYAAGDRGGLKVRDRIIRVDGRIVRTTEQINEIVKKKDPGDLLTLSIQRRKKESLLRITLGHREVAFDMFNRNLLMSGPVSKRKDNFPMILQHDLPLFKEMMGGGIFDLNGYCIGINIARIDRVTSYALPTTVVLPVLNQWIKELP